MGNRCFSLILQRGKLTKKCRGAKFQVIEKKIIGRSSLRFLGKCVGRNLISARSLYPFDNAIDQQSDCCLMGFPSRLVRGIGEQKVGETLLLLLELPPLGNSFSPGSESSLRGRKILGY